LRWQTRIITQPETTSGAVNQLLGAHQRGHDHVAPGLHLPVTCTTIRSRSLFIISTWCVSASSRECRRA
jgi:hypothetical protein